MTVTDRDDLVARGRVLRERLGLAGEAREDPAPGYSRFFDELVFGAIWSRPGLELRARLVATLTALAALERPAAFAHYAQAAPRVGLGADGVREIVLQAGLYVGFPACEPVLAAASVALDAQSTHPDERDIGALDEAGRATMETLHGARASAGYASPDAGAPAELYRLAIRYGYGWLWSRPGLEVKERFIVTLSVFTVLQQTVQLSKFAESALGNGLRFEECVEVIMQVAPYGGFPRCLNALVALETLRSGG